MTTDRPDSGNDRTSEHNILQQIGERMSQQVNSTPLASSFESIKQSSQQMVADGTLPDCKTSC